MTANADRPGTLLLPFATPVLRLRPAGLDQAREELVRAILDRRQREPSNTRSSRGGWQSTKNLHQWPEAAAQKIASLCTNDAASALSKYYSTSAPVMLQVDECWANVNPQGSWNAPHTHDHIWAATYYLRSRAPQGHMGALILLNPLARNETFWQRSEISIEPEDGDLIVFSGGLNHFVEPNPTPELRIGLAFNFFAKTATDGWRKLARIREEKR